MPLSFTTYWKETGPHANCKNPLLIISAFTCCSYHLSIAGIRQNLLDLLCLLANNLKKLTSTLKGVFHHWERRGSDKVTSKRRKVWLSWRQSVWQSAPRAMMGSQPASLPAGRSRSLWWLIHLWAEQLDTGSKGRCESSRTELQEHIGGHASVHLTMYILIYIYIILNI